MPFRFEKVPGSGGLFAAAAAAAAAAIMVAAAPASAASSGFIDGSYGSSGTTLIDEGSPDDGVVQTVVQSDGKSVSMIRVDTLNYRLVRLNTNGSIDSSYGTGGHAHGVLPHFGTIYAEAIQTDDKVVVVGDSNEDVMVQRYTSSGAIDTSFGTNGTVTTDIDFMDNARSVAVQPDGKILVGGNTVASTINSSDDYRLTVLRYLANGTLDSSFASNGVFQLPSGGQASALAVQSNGSIVATGSLVARLTSSGVLDSSFGDGGVVVPNLGSFSTDLSRVIIRPNGDILAGGSYSNSSPNFHAFTMQLHSNGDFDDAYGSSFGVQPVGGATNDVLRDMFVVNGAVVVVGHSDTGASYLARFSSCGAPDTAIGPQGTVMEDFGNASQATTAVPVANGKMLVAGKASVNDGFVSRVTLPALAQAAPCDPASATGSSGNASVTLHWAAPNDNGGSAITGYKVYDESYTLLDSVGPSSTSSTITGLTNGTSYNFFVSATNANGESPGATVLGIVPATVPTAPVNIAGTGAYGSATVSWSPPSSDGGAQVQSYIVTASPGGQGVTVDSGQRNATFPSLPGDVSYTFTVRAVNQVGPSTAGSSAPTLVHKPSAPKASTPTGNGYWLFAADGAVYNYGDAGFFGSVSSTPLNRPVVGGTATPSGNGYWLVASDGGIFSFGDAQFHGSTGSLKLNKPIVGMASTPSGNGYWLVASDGGIFSFGDAQFYGSTGSLSLNKPIVGASTTPSGNGYWLVASDGGIFSFGDAQFFGSTGSLKLNKPIVGMMTTPSGNGYWLVASDGGMFSFGDAQFFGSTGSLALNSPITSATATPSGNGYWLFAKDGGVFSFGDAQFHGSAGGSHLQAPIL